MPQRHPLFGLTWTADGREIITAPGVSGADSDSLWRVTVDGSGDQERLAFTGDESASPSLSRQRKRLAYSRGMFNFNIWRLDLAGMERKAGPPARFISSTRRDTSAQYSPDGKKVAFYSSRSGDEEIWVCNGDGSNAIQITSLHGPSCGTPRWSPDGEQIVFDSNPDGHWDIFVVGANGGKPRRLTHQPSFEAVPSWSRDGKWVYFCSDRGGTYQIWKMPAYGGEAVEVTSTGGFTAFESPDGEFVYYTKSEEGAEGLWRMPVGGGEETQVIDSVVAKRAFFITRDGIYFMTGTKSFTIDFFNFRTRQRNTVVKVENPTLYVNVSPDGRTMLYTQIDQPGTDLMLVENFK
jgi:Tol biopolymer transport system component